MPTACCGEFRAVCIFGVSAVHWGANSLTIRVTVTTATADVSATADWSGWVHRVAMWSRGGGAVKT